MIRHDMYTASLQSLHRTGGTRKNKPFSDLARKAACKRRSGQTVTKIPEHGATLAQVIRLPVCETTGSSSLSRTEKTWRVQIQIQFIDRMVDIHFVQQKQVATVQTAEEEVEIPQGQRTDRIAVASVVRNARFPRHRGRVQNTGSLTWVEKPDNVVDVAVVMQRQVRKRMWTIEVPISSRSSVEFEPVEDAVLLTKVREGSDRGHRAQACQILPGEDLVMYECGTRIEMRVKTPSAA